MMIVRETEEKDLLEIAELEKACFSHPWSYEELKSCLKKGIYRFYTAAEDEKVIGYAGMYYAVDEADIANIAVGGSFRHQGVGRALLRALRDCASSQNMVCMFLEVRAGNIPAIGLYEKEGFQPVGRRKDYYDAPTEDAILYALKLSE